MSFSNSAGLSSRVWSRDYWLCPLPLQCNKRFVYHIMSATETTNAENYRERSVRRRCDELEDAPVRFVFWHNAFEIKFGSLLSPASRIYTRIIYLDSLVRHFAFLTSIRHIYASSLHCDRFKIHKQNSYCKVIRTHFSVLPQYHDR